MPSKLEKKAYSIAEAARLLSLERDQIAWLIDTGQLKTIVIAGQYLVMNKDLDDLLEVYREVQSRAATGSPIGKGSHDKREVRLAARKSKNGLQKGPSNSP